MNNTLLIAASRQIALQRELDIVANNVANVTTNGFKRRTSGFAEFIMPRAKGDALASPDKSLSFVTDGGAMLDISGGAIEKTGNPLDVAIRGDAFLAVSSPAGERYTRNGAMALGASGELVTMDGHAVLTESGPLNFSPADGPITIASDGTVSTTQGVRGKLKLVRFEAPHRLENIGTNLLKAEQSALPAGPGTHLDTGAIERSNVSSVGEVSRLVEITRAYSNIAQMMQRTDEMRRSALSRLADTN